jgi:hypothetical protein
MRPSGSVRALAVLSGVQPCAATKSSVTTYLMPVAYAQANNKKSVQLRPVPAIHSPSRPGSKALEAEARIRSDDAIAMKLGIDKSAMIRVRAGISYALTESGASPRSPRGTTRIAIAPGADAIPSRPVDSMPRCPPPAAQEITAIQSCEVKQKPRQGCLDGAFPSN